LEILRALIAYGKPGIVSKTLHARPASYFLEFFYRKIKGARTRAVFEKLQPSAAIPEISSTEPFGWPDTQQVRQVEAI